MRLMLDSNLIRYKKKIVKIFSIALGKLGFEGDACVALNLISGEQITDLNRNFRKVDKITDVLSFPLFDIDKGENLKNYKDENDLLTLGDIVICKSVAMEQAKNLGHSLKREICFLALHGFLHLLGFDHMDADDEKIMTDFAKEVLNEVGVNR